jgi:DMSO/TMAO reductase YedYZ molybdopterin-dependent catalytic subunit
MTLAERIRPTSTLRDERNAAVLGLSLGVAFSICFVTGLLSHLIQHPPSWFVWPARPAGLYRLTQGAHIATGIASVPLLLAKLWVVYPKLFQRPAVQSTAHALERISLVPLIGGGIFQLTTGIANISQWYPWPFGFRTAHYYVAWITMGALVVHVAAKWTTTRGALARSEEPRPATSSDSSLDRRGFLLTVFGASGLLTLFSVGQTFSPLERLALLAPRRPSVGPQGFPVNRTARGVGVVDLAQDPDYHLSIEGNVARPLQLALAELDALPQHDATLPISCVEGWSTSQRWQGVRIRHLLELAGANPDAEVTVHSLQRGRSSQLNHAHAQDLDTLLARRVNGEILHLDHGFPIRLIGPNRPGTMQTKWVSRLVVH